jgi:hypothetical protein
MKRKSGRGGRKEKPMYRSFVMFISLVGIAGCQGASEDPSVMAEEIRVFDDKNNPITFTDNGLTLTAQGTLAGLGSADATIVLDASGSELGNCVNAGHRIPPGKNPVDVTLSGTSGALTETKNGRYTFSVTTAAPSSPSWSDFGCPSAQWTAQLNDVAFSDAVLSVYQGGSLVYQRAFSL